MAHPKNESTQSHRAIGMAYSNEYDTKASVWPGHVGLNAAAEHRAVLALIVASLESRSRECRLRAEAPCEIFGTRSRRSRVAVQDPQSKRRRQSRPERPAPTGARPRLALVVGWQRAEVAVELLRAEPLLAVTSKDGLHGGIFSFDRLKSSQRSIYPVLGQMIQNCVGLLAGRHAPNGSPTISQTTGHSGLSERSNRAPQELLDLAGARQEG